MSRADLIIRKSIAERGDERYASTTVFVMPRTSHKKHTKNRNVSFRRIRSDNDSVNKIISVFAAKMCGDDIKNENASVNERRPRTSRMNSRISAKPARIGSVV